jgi:hypothetical protein
MHLQVFFSTNAIQVEWLYTVNPPPLEHAKEKQRKNGNFIGEGKGVIVAGLWAFQASKGVQVPLIP